MDLPVLGREEDAADTLSVLLIDRFWEEDAAAAMVTAHALAFLLYAASGEGDDHSYWATHALDMQRYYNLVCLFYGADPAARGDLAADLELPDERRESCPEEWQMASDSWGAMLEGLEPQDRDPQDQGSGLRMAVPEGRDDYTRIVAAEVAAFNAEFGLPMPVKVTVEPCGEANAFYEPEARRIVMCIEYAEDLALLHESAP